MLGTLSCIKSVYHKSGGDQGAANPGIIYFKWFKIPSEGLSVNPAAVEQ